MPFTFVHPAFALPLFKNNPKRFGLSGLIAGSIVPDLDFLFRFTHIRFHIFTLHPIQILLGMWPLAIILSWYLEDIVTPFFTTIKPQHNPLSIHFLPAITGILLHLCIDAITHPDSYWCTVIFLQLLPAATCYSCIISIGFSWGPQLLATSIGVYLYWWYYQHGWFRQIPQLKISNFRVLAITFPIVIVLKFFTTVYENGFHFGEAVITVTGALLVSIFILPIPSELKKLITR